MACRVYSCGLGCMPGKIEVTPLWLDFMAFIDKVSHHVSIDSVGLSGATRTYITVISASLETLTAYSLKFYRKSSL